MKLRPRRVLLDTNAAGSLCEPRQGRSPEDLAVVRNLLSDRARNGSVQVVIAYRLLEEYAPVQRSNLVRYTATLDYLQPLVGPHLLLPVDQLVEREARARRRLRYDECVFDPATRDALWRLARSPEALDAAGPEIEEMKIDHEAQMLRQRERAHEIYLERKLGETIVKKGDRVPALDEVTRAWGKQEVRKQIDSWTRDTLAQMIADRKLPPEAADLEPSAVPTLRAMNAYFMARIVQNVGHRARIRGSDLFDHYHFSSAVYADLIVSDDGDFTRTVKVIDDKFPIQTFEELRTSLRSGGCGPVADLRDQP